MSPNSRRWRRSVAACSKASPRSTGSLPITPTAATNGLPNREGGKRGEIFPSSCYRCHWCRIWRGETLPPGLRLQWPFIPGFVTLEAALGTKFPVLGYRNRTIGRDRLAQRLDPFDFVHSLSGEVRLSTMGTGPHWNAFDYQERHTAAEAACDLPQFDALFGT